MRNTHINFVSLLFVAFVVGISGCMQKQAERQIDELANRIQQQGVEVEELGPGAIEPGTAPLLLSYLLAVEDGVDAARLPEMEWARQSYIQHQPHVIGMMGIKSFLMAETPVSMMQFANAREQDAEAYCKSINELSNKSWQKMTRPSSWGYEGVGMATCHREGSLLIAVHHARTSRPNGNVVATISSGMAMRGRVNFILELFNNAMP